MGGREVKGSDDIITIILHPYVLKTFVTLFEMLKCLWASKLLSPKVAFTKNCPQWWNCLRSVSSAKFSFHFVIVKISYCFHNANVQNWLCHIALFLHLQHSSASWIQLLFMHNLDVKRRKRKSSDSGRLRTCLCEMSPHVTCWIVSPGQFKSEGFREICAKEEPCWSPKTKKEIIN